MEALAGLLEADFFKVVTTTDGTIGLAQKIIDFLSFAESINAGVTILLEEELNTGLKNLDIAARSSVDSIKYIDAATQNFTKACGREKNERLVCAYLGLAFCFYLRGDIEPCKYVLKEFSEKYIDVLGNSFEGLKKIFSINFIASMYYPKNTIKSVKFMSVVRRHVGFSWNPIVARQKREELLKNVGYLEDIVKTLKHEENMPKILEIPSAPAWEKQLEIAKLQNQAKKQIEEYENYAYAMETTLINYRKKIGMI